MQSIIYRRIKYILYIADKPWWVLHMYIMYVNLYLQSFLHIQKAVSIFLCIYLYLYIYIEIFHILPTSICTTIMKKKNIYIYVNPFFILQTYFHKNISLYKNIFFFIYMNTFFSKTRSHHSYTTSCSSPGFSSRGTF